MERKRMGIEEQILEFVESGPVAAVELTLRLANARFKKRTGPLVAAGQRARGRSKKAEASVETASA